MFDCKLKFQLKRRESNETEICFDYPRISKIKTYAETDFVQVIVKTIKLKRTIGFCFY